MSNGRVYPQRMMNYRLFTIPAVVLASLAMAAGCTIQTTSTPTETDAGTVTPTVDGGGADGSVVVTGGCAFGEPNENRDQATALTIGTQYSGCVTTREDADFYEFTAPSDNSGGYVQIALTNVGAGSIAAEVFAASDNGSLTSVYNTTEGESLPVYVSVAPGAKYRLRVADFAGFSAEYKYDLKLTYTKFDDSFEPNNTRDDAKSITKNVPVEAIIAPTTAAGHVKEDDWFDFYAVDLAAGNADVKLENVPTNVNADVQVYNAAGTVVASKYNTTDGASVVVEPFQTAAAKYYVRVSYFASPPASAAKGGIPDNFTRKYKLTVSQ